MKFTTPLLIGLALLVGCAPPPFSTEPSVRVTWPLPESTVVGCTVVTVEVENLALTDFSTEGIANVDGEGHYHVTTPLGYTAVWTPYALISFETIAEADAVLNVQLVDNTHGALLDENGAYYEVDIPLHFVPGECTEFGATPTDTDYDTGGDADQASDTGMAH